MLSRFCRFLLAVALFAPVLSGCTLFEVPKVDVLSPTPTPPPNRPVFDPAAGSTAGVPLNALGDEFKPDAYRAVRAEVESAPIDRVPAPTESDGAPVLYLQTVDTPKAAPGATPAAPQGVPTPNATQLPRGAPRATSIPVPTGAPRGSATPGASRTPGPVGTPVPPGSPLAPGQVLGPRADPVRLAGIVLPTSEPGRTAALNTLQTWMVSGDLDVEQDKIYPFDLRGRARVQVFFKGRKGSKDTEGKRLNLNRLMVRSGYAVVDLYSPTTFDTAVWLQDEQVARGLAPGSKPVGLWRDPTFSFAARPPITPTPPPLGTPTPGAATSTTTTTTTAPAAAATTAPAVPPEDR